MTHVAPTDLGLLASLARHVPGVIYQFRLFPDGRSCFPFASEAMRAIYDVAPDAVREDASAVFARLHPEDLPRVSGSIAQSAADLTTWEAEYRVVLPGRGTRWVHGISNPERLEDGSTLWHGFITDVTERRAAEAERVRLKLAIEHAITGISVSDLEGRVEYVNQATLDMWGFRSLQEVVGRHASEFWADPAEVQATFAQMRVSGTDSRVLTARRADGRLRRIQVRSSTIPGHDGGPGGLLASFLDVTEQEAAAEELRLRDEAMATSVNGIGIASADGRVVYVNPAMVSLLGRDDPSQLVGRRLSEISPSGEAERMLERLRRDGSWQAEWRIPRPDGTLLEALVTSSVVRDADGTMRWVMTSLADITELKRLQAQFLQAQKMETIGRLAGGVAHDFNNLLTVMKGYLGLARGQLAPDSPLGADLAEVEKAADSAAALTQQLLAFSRRQMISPQVLDLNASVHRVEGMLRRLLGEMVELQVRLTPGLAPVRFDPHQIEQVLMNLVVNARDAMPSGGIVTLETGTVELDAGFARRHPEAKPGAYVTLSVSDTGPGLPPEVRAHLFEPFVTTKAPGRGTGLGLAMVYGAVTQNGGWIEVASDAMHGTSFTILLPQMEAPPEARPSPGTSTLPRGEETVAVVEDEPAIRALATRVLEHQGYHVLAFEDGQAAWDALRDGSARVDLLVTDVIMPHLNGRALADRLCAERPGLRVLFVSGYTEDVLAHHGLHTDAAMDFLAKPYSMAVLARRVREVLDREIGS